jgi:hypothetical protein
MESDYISINRENNESQPPGGGPMEYNIDHDRFANKNKSLARAYDVGTRDKELENKGYSHIQRQQEASCFNCKMKNKCVEFRTKSSGGSAGAVSFGGDEKFICSRYTPAPAENKLMSDKQIKSLLKNAKKGLA